MIDSLNRFEKLSGGRYLSVNTPIHTDNPAIKGFIRGACPAAENCYGAVHFIEDIPGHIVEMVNEAFGGVYEENPEGYVIVLEEDITIYARGLRGFVYSANDLTRMAREGFLRQGIVYNTPKAALRCLKVYLPPEENIGFFKQVVDICCWYRCNTLIVEVGGAMEYKRHPEINEGWVAYCKQMHEYSGKTTVIQEQTFPWGKNSIHCENGGGRFLQQEQVRDILAYCRQRGIDVIPEMPTLSHCDYLLTRHPEFAERRNDPYPDTYCPNAPGLYDYVFDVLDEVIEVFGPKVMHIGHDELYSVCVCERCRGKDAAELYANDIIRIHDHLAARSVKTIIWSEKLLNSVSRNGISVGGAERAFRFRGEELFKIPATWPAIEKIPKDILCMHWYWSIVQAWDREFPRHGLPMFFGNFDPLAMPNAAQRLAAGAMGGGPSNWSYATLPYLQENGVLASLACAALLFWTNDFEDERFTEYLEFCFDDLYRLSRLDGIGKPCIEILHTTSHYRPFQYHADGVFLDYAADTVGEHVVEYEDGTVFTIPVVYGQNVTNKHRFWSRDSAGVTAGETDELDSDCYRYDQLLTGVAYSALPVRQGARHGARLP